MFSHEWHNSINDLGWPYQDQTHLRSERHRQIDWSRPVLVINPSSSLIIRPSFSDTCQEKTAQHWHIMDAKNIHNLDFAAFLCHTFEENTLITYAQFKEKICWRQIIHFPCWAFMGENAVERWGGLGNSLKILWQRRSLILGCRRLFCCSRLPQSIRLWDWGEVATGLIAVTYQFILIQKFFTPKDKINSTHQNCLRFPHTCCAMGFIVLTDIYTFCYFS